MINYLKTLRENEPLKKKYERAMKLLDEIHADAIMLQSNGAGSVDTTESNLIENSVRFGWQECWNFFRTLLDNDPAVRQAEANDEELEKITNTLARSGLTKEEIAMALKEYTIGEIDE